MERIASKFICMIVNRPVRICVPVCEKTFAALKTAALKASELGDMVELRLDGLDAAEFDSAIEHIAELVRSLLRPTIITLRPTEEGGYRDLDYSSRYAFWSSRSPHDDVEFFDIERDVVAGFTSPDTHSPVAPNWARTICSYHNFKGMPANLAEIYEQMANSPARILKIAVEAGDVIDCLPVFHLLDRARREGREMIAIAMGSSGIATRILGPSRGSFLTYGALENESATAPGQVEAHELKSLYRIQKIDLKTMICGLVGLPAVYSVSPHMHNAAFESGNVDGVYLPFEVRDVVSFFKRMVHPRTREIDWNLRGLSVTAPHKASVLDCLDWIEPAAKEIGAVNTVVVEADTVRGYNTDAAGLVAPLVKSIGSLNGLRVAVIGAGGAASAAVWALQRQNANVSIFARDPEKGRSLADRFDISCQALAQTSFTGFDVVVNATPVGSIAGGIKQTPATARQLTGARLIYDLVYNPAETELLRQASKAGCETLGGLDMLVAQARLQYKLWTGRTTNPSVMHGAATTALRG